MLKIDNTLLQDIGLGGLPDAEKNSLLKHVYETLEMRVGMRLADQMTNQQLDEFEQYFEAKDDAGAFKWLETNFPNYKDIVQEEFDKLKNEVAQSAPGILGASQAQVQAGLAQPPQPAMPQGQPHADFSAPQPAYQPPTPSYNPALPQQPAQPDYQQPAYQPPAAPAPAQPYAAPLTPLQQPTYQPPQPQPWQPADPNGQQPPQPQNPQYPPQQPPAGPGF
jgi:hypothetical protein